MRRHPWPALVFVWTCDLAGIAAAAYAFRDGLDYSTVQWGHFALWTVVLTAAHLGAIKFVGLDAYGGLFTAIDFAAAMVLPLPLFCLTIAIWFGITVGKRLLGRHPEPFLGPDFNAANVTLDALAAITVYQVVLGLLEQYAFAGTLALMAAAIVFAGLQTVLLTTLLSLDLQKPWRRVGTLETDALAMDGMMVTAGALISRIYLYDPYLMVLAVFILLYLNRTLRSVSEARLAHLDAKTGLYNYRYFDEALTEGFRRALQQQRPLALIFADMDHLRDINNTHGHVVGDKALVEVAAAFKQIASNNGIACRFGGEEFVLMLPGADKFAAAEVAERVRQAVAERSVALDCGGSQQFTVSLGVASFPEDAQSIEELVKAADQAVYESKHAGRNRVSIYRRTKVAL